MTLSAVDYFCKKLHFRWDKVFKDGPNKICGRQTAFKKFEEIWSAKLSSTDFTWSILKCFALDVGVGSEYT